MRKKKPKSHLKVRELLGERSVSDLADVMGLKFYTQIYPYTRKGANPTLLMLEQLASGLSKLLGRKIKVTEIISENQSR